MTFTIGLLQQGGILMIPLYLFSMLALWVFLDRAYHLHRAKGKVGALFAEVRDLLQQGALEAAARRAAISPGPVAAVMTALLQHPLHAKSDLEEVATMRARQELQRLMARVPLLHLIASLAPLIGLLGTVIGMVRAFHKIATTQQEAINPSLLASGIWEALLTTVAGLVVAIPASIFAYYLDQRIRKLTFHMDHYGTLLIRLLATREETNARREL